MKLGNPRQAIHDALALGYMKKANGGIVEYLTYLCKIQKSGYCLDSNADFLEAGYICAAIDRLGYVGGWLKFAYGPDGDADLLQSGLAAVLRFDLFPTSTHKKPVRLLSPAGLSLDD